MGWAGQRRDVAPDGLCMSSTHHHRRWMRHGAWMAGARCVASSCVADVRDRAQRPAVVAAGLCGRHVQSAQKRSWRSTSVSRSASSGPVPVRRRPRRCRLVQRPRRGIDRPAAALLAVLLAAIGKRRRCRSLPRPWPRSTRALPWRPEPPSAILRGSRPRGSMAFSRIGACAADSDALLAASAMAAVLSLAAAAAAAERPLP